MARNFSSVHRMEVHDLGVLVGMIINGAFAGIAKVSRSMIIKFLK